MATTLLFCDGISMGQVGGVVSRPDKCQTFAEIELNIGGQRLQQQRRG